MQPSQIGQSSQNQQQPQMNPIVLSAPSLMLKINADNQNPRRMCAMRVIITILMIIIFAVVFALPAQFRVLNNQIAFRSDNATKGCNPSYFDPKNYLQCSNFSSSNPILGLLLTQLVDSNQFAFIYLRLIKNVKDSQTPNIDQNLEVSIFQLTPLKIQNTNQMQFLLKQKLYNETNKFTISKKSYRASEYESSDNGAYKDVYRFLFGFTRVIVKNGQVQTDFVLFVKFTDFSQINTSSSELSFQALVIQTAFTNFSIIIRGVYGFVSLLTMIIFLRRYFQLTVEDRILQIRFVAISSILLFLFNDPFYAITILRPNSASVFFSCFFVVNFLVFLQLFWVFFLRRIYYESDQKDTELFSIKRSWPFYLTFLAMYILSLILFLQFTYFSLYEIPIIVGPNLDRMKVIPTIAILVIVMTAVGIYQVVLFVLVVRKFCCNSQHQILWRHRNYIWNYPFFFIIFVIFFIAGGSMPYSYEGIWILYGYSFMNLFIFIMQYLYYTPAQELDKKRAQMNRPAQKFSISSDFEMSKNQKKQEELEGNTNLEEDE